MLFFGWRSLSKTRAITPKNDPQHFPERWPEASLPDFVELPPFVLFPFFLHLPPDFVK